MGKEELARVHAEVFAAVEEAVAELTREEVDGYEGDARP